MNETLLIALGALLLNAVGYIVGNSVMMSKFEHRMTRMETHLEVFMRSIPKRRGDEEDTRG